MINFKLSMKIFFKSKIEGVPKIWNQNNRMSFWANRYLDTHNHNYNISTNRAKLNIKMNQISFCLIGYINLQLM